MRERQLGDTIGHDIVDDIADDITDSQSHHCENHQEISNSEGDRSQKLKVH